MKRLPAKAARLGAVGLFVLALTSFVRTPWFLPELFSHFQLQYLVIGTLLLIALFFLRPRYPSSFLFLTAALTLNLINLVPYANFQRLIPGQDIRAQVVDDRETYSLLFANIFKFNFDTDNFIDMVRNADPDIIIVVEVTPEWQNALMALDEIWPYFQSLPQPGSHGMGIYSKYPISSFDVLQMSYEDVPAFDVSLRLNGQTLNLLALHPRPPVNQAFYRMRNQHFDWVRAHYQDYNADPFIVVGDLNTTMFAPQYKRLTRATKLKNARTGRGLQKSWFIHGIRPLGIPIDHVLHNDQVRIRYSNVTPDIKSDHRPLLTYFTLVR